VRSRPCLSCRWLAGWLEARIRILEGPPKHIGFTRLVQCVASQVYLLMGNQVKGKKSNEVAFIQSWIIGVRRCLLDHGLLHPLGVWISCCLVGFLSFCIYSCCGQWISAVICCSCFFHCYRCRFFHCCRCRCRFNFLRFHRRDLFTVLTNIAALSLF
jgi:hypothetical protein